MIKVLEGMNVDIFMKDNLKQTPMYYAAREGKTKVIQYLIDKGLDVNNIDTYG
jgi:ankyrin repeat protein